MVQQLPERSYMPCRGNVPCQTLGDEAVSCAAPRLLLQGGLRPEVHATMYMLPWGQKGWKTTRSSLATALAARLLATGIESPK